MTRTGIVERVLEDGRVIVLLSDASCEGCSTPCGACAREQKPKSALVSSQVSVSPGDRVELFCSSGAVVGYSLLLFLLPLTLALALCLGLTPVLGEGAAALVGALGALLFFLLLGALLSHRRFRDKNSFVLTRVLDGAPVTKRT